MLLIDPKDSTYQSQNKNKLPAIPGEIIQKYIDNSK